MDEKAVLIAGAGPTGLMLAAELTLAGVDVAVLERRAGDELLGTRARGLHARTIEVLDQRGIAGRFLATGRPAQVAGFAGVPLDISAFPSRHPYGLALVQVHIERILLGWAEELGVAVLRGHEVTAVTEDGSGVIVDLAGGERLRARYLVGCDGGRSTVRKAAGIGFPGFDATVSHLMAEAVMTADPPMGMLNDERGLRGITPAEDGRVQVLLTEPAPGRREQPTLADLRTLLVELYGSDFGIRDAAWITRFTDAARHAEQYRKGRVLLAGDAAHIHYPVGGQGLNLGLQDAVNLGWKVAQVVKGNSPESLLDTYHAERHPVAARAIRDTLAAVAAGRQDARSRALRDLVAELLAMEEPARHLAGVMSGLSIRYDLGGGHPLVGHRVPDLDLETEGGPLRLHALLHGARPLLLNLGAPGAIAIGPWAGRVPVVDARYSGAWELPVVGPVPSPAAVLVRPDGYVAWAGGPGDTTLPAALARWFGPPAA